MSTEIRIIIDERLDNETDQWDLFTTAFNNLDPIDPLVPSFKIRINQTGLPEGSDQKDSGAMDLRAFVRPAVIPSTCSRYGRLSIGYDTNIFYVPHVSPTLMTVATTYYEMYRMVFTLTMVESGYSLDFEGNMITPFNQTGYLPAPFNFSLIDNLIGAVAMTYTKYKGTNFSPQDPLFNEVGSFIRGNGSSGTLFYIDERFIGQQFTCVWRARLANEAFPGFVVYESSGIVSEVFLTLNTIANEPDSCTI